MPFAGSTRLGPYEILDLLGAGGMGEVYRALDPRLGREVAIKVLPAEVACSPERLARFEREARAVAALNHPNILTVFDVGTAQPLASEARAEAEGSEPAAVPYVVTELLEGETLREVARRRAPGQRQVLSFAVQIVHGLAAAHAKGIVHRDVKPENVFVTTDGRVKLLDFGLAKLAEQLASEGEPTESSPTAAGQVLGTVGYMSPEQVRGLPIDARTDIFSFGVLLYELLSGRQPFRRDTAVATLTAILEQQPPELSTLGRGVSPALSGIVRRCIEKEREERFGSARDLAFALEAVLQAPVGSVALQEIEEKSPYPGLASFTEKEAAFFFGREEEIATLWRRIASRKLLAVIGPSGAGKTSFLRAGILAARPSGWAAVYATPGASPGLALAQAFTGELAGDAETMAELLRGVAEMNERGTADGIVSVVQRWRSRHGEALLVVDQFEELFTLCGKQTQQRFADLLGRLAADADVHVVLSLRDDFLMRCDEQPALAGTFTELTPLGGLTVDALRRAVVEPARKRGYAFEDDALVAEMLESVDGARGVLPLLAFAVSRLWEMRDREQKLLTRAAHEEIGGVPGALAQHAEATMDRIGPERQQIVRELFRNLVTGQGTRAVVDREELLSAFTKERAAAEEVLRLLVDARLLTSYEVEARDGRASLHRIEVVHESLLEAWPRLVRWQMQDADGAVLRDQMRQAAHLWHEKGRSSDLLWTGTALQEFELWRARYEGALTAMEEDFARAMRDKARRRKRLVRTTVAAAFLLLAGVAVAISVLRHQALTARDDARAEALRSEAGKLLALGRTHLDADPSAALAFARGSLDLFDTPDARRFAVETLWRGPVARLLPVDQMVREFQLPRNSSRLYGFAFSPDGRWIATSTVDNRRVLLFDRDGGPPRTLPRQPDGPARVVAFGPRSDLLVTGGSGQSLRFWSLPELREARTVKLGGLHTWWGHVRGDTLILGTSTSGPAEGWGGVLQAIRLPDGELQVVGVNRPKEHVGAIDPSGTQVFFQMGQSYGFRSLDANRRRVLGQGAWVDAAFDGQFSPNGDRIAAGYLPSGDVRIWSTGGSSPGPLRVFHGPPCYGTPCSVHFLPGGRHLAQMGSNNDLHLWDLEGPPDARPLVLGRPGAARWIAADPTGRWLTTYGPAESTIDFWPLSSPRRLVLARPGASPWGRSVSFTGDGRWLATCSAGEFPRLWPMNASDGSRRDLQPPEPCGTLATAPADRKVLVSTGKKVFLFPAQGGPPRLLATRRAFGAASGFMPVAFDAGGTRAVAAPWETWVTEPEARVLHVWDLLSGQDHVYSIAGLTDGFIRFTSLALAPDGNLYAAGQGGVRRLVLPKDPGGAVSSQTVYAAETARADLCRNGKLLLIAAGPKPGLPGETPFEELLLSDLERRTSRRITTHGTRLSSSALSPSGRIVVTGDADGVVRVGRATGEEPHLLFGHTGRVTVIAISPDERWIATASDDALSLWPMPDLSKPPLHTLHHGELMAKLDALTNLRVVRDAGASTGWRLDVGPFPGWKDVPTW